MTRSFTLKSSVLFGLALLSGCAASPRDAGFPGVQKTVMERTGQEIQWNQGTDNDRAVQEHVKALLKEELRLESAVQIALLNNENLQATYEELGIAQAELVDAGLLNNPSLTAEVRFPRGPFLPLEFNVTQSFIELLLLPVRRKVADAAFEAAKLRVTDEVLQVAAETKAAYYKVVGAAELLNLRRTILKATEASYEATKGLHVAGNISDLGLANERALYEKAKVDLRRAEADAQNAREELNEVMGLWGQDTEWTSPDQLPELPKDEVSVVGLESIAIAQRPDLTALNKELAATAQNLGLSRYGALGDFTIGGHFVREVDGGKTAGPNITVPVPIFNQGQGAIAAAEARLRQTRHRYLARAVQVRAEVRRARNKLIAARDEAMYLQRVIVPLRHEIVGRTQLLVNGMFVGVFQLLQAKEAEIDAGRDYVESLTNYWVARTELERVVGGSFGSDASTTVPSPGSPPAKAAVPTVEPEHHHHGE